MRSANVSSVSVFAKQRHTQKYSTCEEFENKPVLANQFFFFRQIFDRPLSKQKVWRQKLLLCFHLKQIICELHNYSKELSLSFDQSFSKVACVRTSPPPSPQEKLEKGRLYFSASRE